MHKSVEARHSRYRAVITGSGSFVPAKVLTNDDLSKMVDTSDEWITTRTGIKTRHLTTDQESTSVLAIEAAKRALADAGVQASEIDLIILATVTPEMPFPATACFVQQAIGATRAWGFDLAAACSGFVYSTYIAQQFIETGQIRKALVIGAETLTKITNWKDRTSCILFGDGAGAIVLERSEDEDRGVLYSTMGTDGGQWDLLCCQAYGSRHPSHGPLEDPNQIYISIRGREVYQQAVRSIVDSVTKALEACNLTIEQIAMLIPHQMNARIIESAAKRLDLPDDKVFVNIDKYGNTSAASLAIAFDECRRSGRLKKGDIVVFVAFGAGLTWGANVIRL
jgi:3-oxoacyl-[acyl-carrier-protein] synthase-3